MAVWPRMRELLVAAMSGEGWLYTFDNTRNKSPQWLRIPIQRFYSILLGSTSPTIFTWFRRRLDAIHQNSISYGVLAYTTFLASYGCLRLLKQYSTFSTVRYTVSVTVLQSADQSSKCMHEGHGNPWRSIGTARNIVFRYEMVPLHG